MDATLIPPVGGIAGEGSATHPAQSGAWQDLPEGHYAIRDPHDPGTITYWRRKDIKGRHGARPAFTPWPLKARNGPRLLARDVPVGLRGQVRAEWVRAWYARVRHPYDAAVVEAIAADIAAAGKRFADLTSRCCRCGRALTDDHSKVYGIGPECRAGLTADQLAAYFTPRLGRAHAEYLADKAAQ